MLKKVAGVLVAVSPMGVFAALPTEVTAAVTAAQTDGIALVGALAAAGAAVFIIAKLLRKFGLFL